MENIKIMTCNVQGLNDKNKRRQFFTYFKEKRADIVMIQETHCTRVVERIWQAEWGSRIIFSNGESNSRGVAILINRNLDCVVCSIQRDLEGRFLIARVKISDQEFCLINVYAPNNDNPDFFADLFARVSEIEAHNYILGGDLNKVLDPSQDKKGGGQELSNSALIIRSFLEEAEWCDIWRELHPETFQFTWRRRKPNVMTCLVYFLTPLGLLGKVSGCTILPAQLSDHCPVVLQFELQNQIWGPGYWKFNVSHLNDKEFVDEINKIIDIVEFRYDNLNPINKWEMIKYDIREYTMSYSSIKAKECKQNKNRLEKRLKTL